MTSLINPVELIVQPLFNNKQALFRIIDTRFTKKIIWINKFRVHKHKSNNFSIKTIVYT